MTDQSAPNGDAFAGLKETVRREIHRSRQHALNVNLMVQSLLKKQKEAQEQTTSAFLRLHQRIEQVQAAASRASASANAPAHAAAAAPTAEKTEYEEYLEMALFISPEMAPPYVPVCDGDINRTGRCIMKDWMREQRMLMVISCRKKHCIH